MRYSPLGFSLESDIEEDVCVSRETSRLMAAWGNRDLKE